MKNDPDELLPTRWTLIERLKNWDDQESWRQFFDTYWKLIYGVAIKSGLTHPEAQDVVQETVISVCKSMQNFKADPAYGSFKAWLSQGFGDETWVAGDLKRCAVSFSVQSGSDT